MPWFNRNLRSRARLDIARRIQLPCPAWYSNRTRACQQSCWNNHYHRQRRVRQHRLPPWLPAQRPLSLGHARQASRTGILSFSDSSSRRHLHRLQQTWAHNHRRPWNQLVCCLRYWISTSTRPRANVNCRRELLQIKIFHFIQFKISKLEWLLNKSEYLNKLCKLNEIDFFNYRNMQNAHFCSSCSTKLLLDRLLDFDRSYVFHLSKTLILKNDDNTVQWSFYLWGSTALQLWQR